MNQQQAIYDDLLEWERELAADYGLAKALRVLRLGRGKMFARDKLRELYGVPPQRRR